MTPNTKRQSMLAAAVVGALMSSLVVEGYIHSGHYWTSPSVLYYVNPQSSYLSADVAINAVRMAAATWNDTDANIELVYAGTTTGASLTMNYKNEVFFRNGSNGNYAAETYSWWDSSGRYKDSDIVFYEGMYPYFSISGCSRGIYAENVGTHEFGHMLGLKHSTVSGATMRASMPSYCDRTWSSLEADDISGIQALYPPQSGTGQPPAAPTALLVAVNTAAPSSSLLLAWVDNASDETGFRIERGTGAGFVAVGQVGAGVHVFTDSSLAAGTTYYYRVSAYNGSGNSAYTNTASGQTGPAVGSSTVVLSAHGYKVKGLQHADLTWSGVPDASVDVYRNNVRIASQRVNDGSMTDAIGNNGGGSYRYRVCSAGTNICSNEALVSF